MIEKKCTSSNIWFGLQGKLENKQNTPANIIAIKLFEQISLISQVTPQEEALIITSDKLGE